MYFQHGTEKIPYSKPIIARFSGLVKCGEGENFVKKAPLKTEKIFRKNLCKKEESDIVREDILGYNRSNRRCMDIKNTERRGVQMNISMNPNGELVQSVVNAPDVVEIPDSFLTEAKRFRELMMMYTCAIRQVKAKLEILNDDLAVRYERNPIQMINSRVKKPASILEKLKRRGYPVSVDSISENLYDVAGVRVICSFVDDIYTVAEMLAHQDDVEVLMVKDYIRCPKVNGYRSYHMIIRIPVFFSDKKVKLRVEVQIRTIAMDFWASLDHQMKYKRDLDEAGEISEELKECAEVIAQTDRKMLSIRRKIEDRDTHFSPYRFDRD